MITESFATKAGAESDDSVPKPKKRIPDSNMASDIAAARDAVAVKELAPNIPLRHKGGPIPKDGAYKLKAGEHVLTAKEADTARKHALMASGMKSLAKPAIKGK